MQIYSNSNQVRASFQNPQLQIAGQQQSKGNSRSSSFHEQKNHPNVVFGIPAHRAIQRKQQDAGITNLPRKVSFHYTNIQSQQNQLNYPPNLPVNERNALQRQSTRRMSHYSKKSNQSSKKTQQQNSWKAGNNMQSQVRVQNRQMKIKNVTLGAKDKNLSQKASGNNIRYHDQFLRQQIQIEYGNPRERSDSEYSSKSSTKIVVETLRKVNGDGTKGPPIEHKHRIQTEYLTTQNNIRHNHHIFQGINRPQHIIINDNYHNPQQINRNFYSPQLTPDAHYVDRQNYMLNQQNQSGLRQDNQLILHPTIIHRQLQRKTYQKPALNKKPAKYSQVFSYPVRNSGQNEAFYNRGPLIGRTIKKENFNHGEQNFKSFPINTQSKFQDPRSHKINYNQLRGIPNMENKSHQDQLPSQLSENSNSIQRNLPNLKQSSCRGYGADIAKQMHASRANHVNSHNLNSQFCQNLNEQHQIGVNTDNNQEGRGQGKRSYFRTTQFYSISQRMIDEIFRNQTEKAMLKLQTIEHNMGPRRYFSPNAGRYHHHRDTQRKNSKIKYMGQTQVQIQKKRNQQKTNQSRSKYMDQKQTLRI